MDFYAKAERLRDKDFKQITGVEKATFDVMVKILKEAYAQKPKQWRGGRKKKPAMENQLLMTLKYLRQYVTQKELAFEFEVGEATVCDTIRWVEDTLIKDGSFSLPGKKVLLEDDGIEAVLVDVTECPVERPKKQRKWYFGKKKRHTIKAQIVVNRANGIIKHPRKLEKHRMTQQFCCKAQSISRSNT